MKKQFLLILIIVPFFLTILTAHGQVQIGGDIDGEAARDESGASVSLSYDGSVLAIGAWSNAGNGVRSGHVRVYHVGASGVSIGAPMQVDAMVPFEVTFTFDRGVTDFNEEDITVTNATVNNLTGSGSTYTATLVPTSLCEDITRMHPSGSTTDGTILFKFDNGYTRPWDATHRGSSLPAGAYLYVIQNGPHTYRGTVTILL